MSARRYFLFDRPAGGFSLIELIMVIVLLGVVAAVAAPVLSGGFRAYFIGRDITETDWQARVALERMSRELRTVRAPADLTLTSASDITFTDVDGNSIRYCMGTVAGCPGAAGELMRNTQPLAAGISGLTFSYLTRAAAATGVAAQVFYITVAFTATQNTVSKSFQTTASPRNFP
jgi:prepilin-type N-terminal cleavage/methylation domain-containing protein